MKTYCLVCRKNTDNTYSKMIKTKTGRLKLVDLNVRFVQINKVDL